MSEKTPARIPVNLIAGPLGVGKTTTINHLLRSRTDGERWAVLVNEYGLVGVDGALMDPTGRASGVQIKEVAGGCICCSAGFMFQMSLALLLQRRPDRLLIEPTGLAELSGILDTLSSPGIEEAVDVRSVVCMLDPSRIEQDVLRDEVQDQIEAADVLLASRTDLATEERLRAFDDWAQTLFPAKRFVGRVVKGRVPLELLDLVADRGAATPRGASQQDQAHHLHRYVNESHGDGTPGGTGAEELQHDAAHPIVQRSHRSPLASTVGWACWKGLVFDAERASRWLTELARLPGARRIKAVLRTNEGWRGFNFADGVEEAWPTSHRRDSRLELVVEQDQLPDTDQLELALRECLVSPPPA